MTNSGGRQLSSREPAVLKRLRQAVQASGLSVDLAAPGAADSPMAVSNRLAQTTVRYLTTVDPGTGQQLAEELRSLSSSQDWDMLMEDRGYTHYHVVQFLYEYAKHYAQVPESEYFCAGMGRGGGGIQVAPELEVVSLVHLLTTAMPTGSDRRCISMLMELFGPLVLSKIFPANMAAMEVAPVGEGGLTIQLRHQDTQVVEGALSELGLGGDAGLFFYNTALHVQGTLELGWRTFARDAEHSITMAPLITARAAAEREAIVRSCACQWSVTWTPQVELARIDDPADLLEQARIVYDALNRKEELYYLERIKSLESRVHALEAGDGFRDLIGTSSAMRRVFDLIPQVAGSDLTVLVRGESGTGKELVARAIHDTGPRREQPFVAVNCAAFTESLLESELFGHEQGAFTGADRMKPGRFELADGGTLFLDEVGDIPVPTQVKLLRVLETQQFERVGGTRTLHVDVRIVGATNRDLESMIDEGAFREDFYFRLNVLTVDLPPLRDHADDIPQLAQHFLDETARRAERSISGFSRGALEQLVQRPWPGNIRQLRNVIERAVVVYARGEVVREEDVEQALGLRDRARAAAPIRLNLRQRRLLQHMAEVGRSCAVEDLMEVAREVGARAGASRRTLQNDLRRLSDLGMLEWCRDGSARVYTLTGKGAEAADRAG